MIVCKQCEKVYETSLAPNKLFCNKRCYDKFRRLYSGTSLLPNTTPKREVHRKMRIKRNLEIKALLEVARKTEVKVTDNSKERRLSVMNNYGGAKCACCGESIFEFLQIDHMDGIGKHKSKIPRAGKLLINWLIKNDFPPGFQVLCVNCNFVKRFGAPCPHSLIRAGVYGQPGPTNEPVTPTGAEPLISPTNTPTEVSALELTT